MLWEKAVELVTTSGEDPVKQAEAAVSHWLSAAPDWAAPYFELGKLQTDSVAGAVLAAWL